MTRKDFIAIAEVIREARQKAESTTHAVQCVDQIQEGLVYILAESNPLFDRERFRAACGSA